MRQSDSVERDALRMMEMQKNTKIINQNFYLLFYTYGKVITRAF
nr:MAG TPA: hypothetical protein [Caudoviricetes sp.]